MQAGTFLPDDQYTVRTLPEEATWSAETDRDGTLNLPPATAQTDTSNVPDPNEFAWPLFTTDTGWQFDFDVPMNSASTDAHSSALTELDMSQFYNRPQGFDSTECSGELMGYSNLIGKVSNDPAFCAKMVALTHTNVI